MLSPLVREGIITKLGALWKCKHNEPRYICNLVKHKIDLWKSAVDGERCGRVTPDKNIYYTGVPNAALDDLRCLSHTVYAPRYNLAYTAYPRFISDHISSRYVCNARDDAVFMAAAAKTLQGIASLFEGVMEEDMDFPLDDIEYDQSGSLSIDLISPGGKIFNILMNRHYITKQIWYSNQVSGAHYFNLSEGREPRVEGTSPPSKAQGHKWPRVQSMTTKAPTCDKGSLNKDQIADNLIDQLILDIKAITGMEMPNKIKEGLLEI